MTFPNLLENKSLFYKTIKIRRENERVAKTGPHIPKVTSNWAQYTYQVTQSHLHILEVTESRPKVSPK